MSIKQAIEALENLLEAADSMKGTYGRIWGETPEDEDIFTHDQWAQNFLSERADAARAALAALRSMPAEPVATIRYERGTPGKENDMPKVVSCNWLPDGVYSVYATPHTAPVPAEPVEVLRSNDEGRTIEFDAPVYIPAGCSLAIIATPHTEAVRMSEAWQPIETAPKDGRTLLLGYFNSAGKWRTLRGQWMSQNYIDEYWEDPEGVDPWWFETAVEADEAPNCWATEPTHWQPLPPPPVEQATAARLGVKMGDV